MKGAESLLLIAFLALVGLGLWNARDWLRSPHILSVGAKKEANATPGLPIKSVAEPVKSKKKSGERGNTGTILLQSELLSATEVKVLVPPARFPEPRDLQSGMSPEQITSSFGEPTASVTRPEHGEISQWLYYFNQEHTRATVAYLHGGVLVSAETMRF